MVPGSDLATRCCKVGDVLLKSRLLFVYLETSLVQTVANSSV